MSATRRTFQEVEPHAMFMTDDWASAFRPEQLNEEESKEIVQPPLPDEPVEPVGFIAMSEQLNDEATIADVNEILISLKNIHDLVLQENIDLKKRVHIMEQMLANPPWLNDLNGNLQAVLRDNASAMVGANNQFMAILIRKLDELEERLSSDDPAFTNILYSAPELFNEIVSRPDDEDELSVEEEFAAKKKIAETVNEENPELLTDYYLADSIAELVEVLVEDPPTPEQEELEKLSDDPNFNSIRASFDSWKAKEIKWHEFVKAAGGVKNAGMWKKKFTEESP